MASSSSSTATSGLPKWQLALGLSAAAGALGVSYWYLRGPKKSLGDLPGEKKIDGSVSQIKLSDVEKAQIEKNDGNECFKRGKYDKAIEHYNAAIAVCPLENSHDLATFYQNRAAAYEKLSDWEAVVNDSTKAIELNPRYTKAFIRRAKAYENLKEWQNSLDDVTCSCLLNQFQDPQTLAMADRVLKELGKEHAKEYLLRRQTVYPSSNFVRSHFCSFSEDPVYKRLLETEKDLLGLGELRGFRKAKLAFAKNQYEEIIPACTEEIDSSEAESSDLLEAFSLRATFQFLIGNFIHALSDLCAVINHSDTPVKLRVNALIRRALILMQLDRLEDCLADFELAARLGPDISDVYHHRGQIKLLMDKIDDSCADFKKAVQLNPNFDIAYMQKCYSDYRYAMQSQDVLMLNEAMMNFKQGLDKFPNCVEAYVLYAQVLTERQEFQEAEKMYGKAIVIDKTNANVLVHKALLNLQWHGDLAEAVEIIKCAIEIDSKCQFAYETLGTVEVQRGNLLVAIEMFNKAIELGRSEIELIHLFSLRNAATAQLKISNQLGLDVPTLEKNN